LRAGQVEADAEPDCRDWNSREFFKVASAADAVRCLAAGADVEDSNGDLTPLLQAAEQGSAKTVKALLAAGANVGARSPLGSTPLHFAAGSGSVEKVTALISAGAEIEAGSGILFEQTPLHWAADENAEAVKALLAAGANTEALAQFDRTALHIAASSGSVETVKALLVGGADPLARDQLGDTPLLLAARVGAAESVGALRQAGGLSCADWRKWGFFGAATASEVASCIANGIDIHERFTQEGGLTALHMAASAGFADTVTALLKAGADVDALVPNDHGFRMTPLLVAIQGNNYKTVKALLNAGADLEVPIFEGQMEVRGQNLMAALTPLHVAVGQFEGIEVVRALLEANASIAADAYGLTPLHMASDVEIVGALLAAGADIHALTFDGRTPLHGIAAGGTPGAVNSLLSAGAIIEARDAAGETPLHHAAASGTAGTIKALLAAGADITAQNAEGVTPPEIERRGTLAGPGCADWSGEAFFVSGLPGLPMHIERCLVLGSDPKGRTENGWTPLHHAAASRSAGSLGLLLEAGADIEARRDEDGWTALHVAAAADDRQSVGLLLQSGADVAARNDFGWTPLHVASHGENAEIVHALWRAGGDVEARTDNGDTPLHLVRGKKMPYGTNGTIKILMKAGADIEARNQHGRTPLHSASLSGTFGAVTALLEWGADIEVRNEFGWTPLHETSAAGASGSVAALLAWGANTGARKMDGSTALHFAAQKTSGKGGKKVIALLVNAGAYVEARKIDGRTPLHQAAAFGTAEPSRRCWRQGPVWRQGTSTASRPCSMRRFRAFQRLSTRSSMRERTPRHATSTAKPLRSGNAERKIEEFGRFLATQPGPFRVMECERRFSHWSGWPLGCPSRRSL